MSKEQPITQQIPIQTNKIQYFQTKQVNKPQNPNPKEIKPTPRRNTVLQHPKQNSQNKTQNTKPKPPKLPIPHLHNQINTKQQNHKIQNQLNQRKFLKPKISPKFLPHTKSNISTHTQNTKSTNIQNTKLRKSANYQIQQTINQEISANSKSHKTKTHLYPRKIPKN